MDFKLDWTLYISNTHFEGYVIGQMPLASDPRTAHVSHHRSQNSLNIDLTGIHALGNLLSVKL